MDMELQAQDLALRMSAKSQPHVSTALIQRIGNTLSVLRMRALVQITYCGKLSLIEI
jgi:hypothetical protein